MALSKGICPIHIGHEYSINVNPNEFDTELTKYIYNKHDLVRILYEKKDINLNIYKQISEKYFNSEFAQPIKLIIQNRIKTFLDNN